MATLRALTELAASFDRAEILVLCYHPIRGRERFAAQMSVLAERGYSVLSMTEFMACVRGGKPLRSPAVLLTFDGWYPADFASVVPILKSYDFPAVFFMVSWCLSDESGERSTQYRKELLELATMGYAIGSHSHTHQDLTKLSVADLESEVTDSRTLLEQVLGQRVDAFCYPYGAWDLRVASVVRKAGFDVAFTVDLGGVSSDDDPYQLKRVPILGEPGTREFATYLTGTVVRSGAILLYWKLRERLLDMRHR
jgi:peptidoglycan/xylan/chitin deacetylase (PgdA/CDA1 family)